MMRQRNNNTDMDSFRLAVKAFCVQDGKLLIVQRAKGSTHQPNMWELPGGRLDIGENPFDGLPREVKEETGFDVIVQAPLSVRHFTRQDGQTITLIVFVCEITGGTISVSEEHQHVQFVPLDQYTQFIDPWYYDECERYLALYS